jgi:Uma2 family endonuclease
MTSPTAERFLSAEEYGRTMDPPGTRTELLRGRVVRMQPARTIDGYIASEISFALEAFARAYPLGITTGRGGYLLQRDPDTVRAPDAAFLANHRIPPGGLPEDAYIEGAPTLAVEVVSPDDRDGDVAEKVALWLSAGAERVWEVRPRTRTVTVHRQALPPVTLRSEDSLSSDDAAFAVDGFSLLVGSIFA